MTHVFLENIFPAVKLSPLFEHNDASWSAQWNTQPLTAEEAFTQGFLHSLRFLPVPQSAEDEPPAELYSD